eukprot:CAMPEP_0177674348 /NCGR_PEP_ID=MMETSP0447-20121125/26500_1 /TAXON_ID=0 /ORGANISM="Stygamoeba regulata, Strain BSH-02190019" /LENGTH=163 /DNA_ID=CAMNT_0019182423 /DNA_START=512 /DNA_END=1001 /DNA_ORIENTATION=+
MTPVNDGNGNWGNLWTLIRRVRGTDVVDRQGPVVAVEYNVNMGSNSLVLYRAATGARIDHRMFRLVIDGLANVAVVERNLHKRTRERTRADSNNLPGTRSIGVPRLAKGGKRNCKVAMPQEKIRLKHSTIVTTVERPITYVSQFAGTALRLLQYEQLGMGLLS